MKPIKTVIVDDEPAAVEVIQMLLQEFSEDIILEGTARNGLEAIQLISRCKPDLVFLDVDMPVMNGFQVLEKFPGMHFEVIFTTGSSEHALKALKVKAIDYLLKPIDPADFILAVEQARNLIEVSRQKGGGAAHNTTRIQLPAQNGIIYLDEEDVVHVEGMGSYCQVHTAKNEKILVSKNIGQIEEKLSPAHFFRCHNSHIINLAHVSKFLHKDGYVVEMKDGSLVDVSRRSKEKLLEALAHHSR
jgi:two-component system LytT family response regulator